MALYSLSELSRNFQNSAQSRYASINLSESSKSFSGAYDIFLSHSSLDAEIVSSIKQHIESVMGFSVYVYWINDPSLTSAVTKANAQIIKSRMDACKSLIYAFTDNSVKSKWMPWELGYFDGKKNKVAILPISSESTSSDSFLGQEYLGLYPYITKNGSSLSPNKEILWIHDSADTYVTFRGWLHDGLIPTKK